jgi:hypothetical protein
LNALVAVVYTLAYGHEVYCMTSFSAGKCRSIRLVCPFRDKVTGLLQVVGC